MSLFEKLCENLLKEVQKNAEKHAQEIKSQEERVIYLNDMKTARREMKKESKNGVSQ